MRSVPDSVAAAAAAAEAYTSPEYTHCLREPRFRHNVYEPEADSFLFLEALDKDAPLLRALQPRRCVEIGCGSGVVLTHLRCLLMPTNAAPHANEETGVAEAARAPEQVQAEEDGCIGGPMFCAVDINPIALEAAGVTWTETLRRHFGPTVLTDFYRREFACDVPVSLAAPVVSSDASAVPASPTAAAAAAASTYTLHRFHGDLFDAVRRADVANITTTAAAAASRARHFDVVLFNPPYVPTSLAELEDAIAQKDIITAAWCGGPRGRVVLDRFMRRLPAVLSRRGFCYVVLIKENDVADVVSSAQAEFRAHLRQAGEWAAALGEAEAVLEAVEVAARYTGEHLCVYRLRYLPRFQQDTCQSGSP